MGARNLALSAICLFVVSLLAGSGVAWLTRGSPPPDDQVAPAPATSTEPPWQPTDDPMPTPTSPPSSDTPDPTPFSDPSPSDPTSSQPSQTPSEKTRDEAEQSAQDELNRLAAADRPTIDFDGQPVALLASKYVGLKDKRQETSNGSNTFLAVDILAEHQNLKTKYGAEHDVVLFKKRSTRGKYRGETFWYTYAMGGFSSKDDVTSFCAREYGYLVGEDRNNRCVARTLE